MIFAMIAAKRQNLNSRPHKGWDKNGMTLAIMIVKKQLKNEYGLKSLRELDTKQKLDAFEKFLESKL